MEGTSLATIAIIVISIFILGIVFGKAAPITLTAIMMSVAGSLAWLPNSVLPNHHFAGYSWSGAYLLFSPILLLPSAFRRGSWLIKTILAMLIIVIAVSPLTFSTTYAKEKWTVDNQLRQRRLVTGLRDQIKSIPSGQSSVIVSGLNKPFSPFDHWQSIFSLHPPEGFQFHVVRYPTIGSENNVIWSAIGGIDAMPGVVTWITPGELNYDDTVNIWLFRSDGSLIQLEKSYLHDWAYFGIKSLDLLRYPDLLDLVSSYNPDIATESDRGYALLKCGGIFLSYNAIEKAETCLNKSAELIPENPYSHYFLGVALERQGKNASARLAYSTAVKLEGNSPNPAFGEALLRINRK